MNTQTADTNAMSTAALLCGILSIPCGPMMFGIVFSGLGIAFAFLSRGSRHMNGMAAVGLCCSIAGIFLFLVTAAAILIYALLRNIPLPADTLEYGLMPFLMETFSRVFPVMMR